MRSDVAARATVVLVGGAGVGKTHLCRQAVRDVPHLVGQCLEPLRDRPYRPIAHAVGPIDAHASVAEVAAHVADAVGDRLLVVEDLQWADEPTLSVLVQLASVVPMVCTTRGPDPFSGGVRRHRVEPMAGRSSGALARRMHPSWTDDEIRTLTAAADGVPLLLRDLGPHRPPRSQAASPAAAPAHAPTSARDAGPTTPTLRAAVADRLARLDADDQLLLQLLAVHGRPVPDATLRDAAGRPRPREASAGDGLRGLASEGPDGLRWFDHEVVLEVTTAAIDPVDRTALHARLAEHVDPLHAPEHLLAAGLRGRAAAAAIAAANTLPRSDSGELARLLRLAVDADPDGAPNALRIRAAAALLTADRPDDAEAVLVAAADPADPNQATHIGLLRARARWARDDGPGALVLLDEALGPVAGTGSAAEARLVVERAHIGIRMSPADPEAIAAAAHAMEIAERTGTAEAQAHVLAGRAKAHSFRRGWQEHYRCAQQLARRDRDRDQELEAAYLELSALGFFGPLVDALAVGRGLIARTEEVGDLRWNHLAVGAHGIHAAVAGATAADLPDRIQDVLDLDPGFRNRSQLLYALVVAHLDRRDLRAAQAQLESARRSVRSSDDNALAWLATAAVARVSKDVELMSAALRELSVGGHGFYGLKVVAESDAIHLALETGQSFDIPRYSALCPPILSIIGEERRAFELHVEGRHDDAAAAFAEAATRAASEGTNRFAARDLIAAARCCAASGRWEEAERSLIAAAELCQGDESRAWVLGGELDDVERLVVDVRTRRRRERLTARELEVLERVAEGATSTDIAAALGISVDTVESHVGAARRKLGAATRRQAGALVALP